MTWQEDRLIEARKAVINGRIYDPAKAELLQWTEGGTRVTGYFCKSNGELFSLAVDQGHREYHTGQELIDRDWLRCVSPIPDRAIKFHGLTE